MTNRPKEKPSSGAEITRTGRHFFTRLKNSAQMTFEPSAEDCAIGNAVATVPVEQTKLLNSPTSGAEITEITPHGRDRFTQLKRRLASKALRRFGKKGDLTNGPAAIHVGQTDGRFSSDELITDDSGQDVEIIIGRNISPNLSAVPRQGTAASQQDTAASQQDTATIVKTSFLSSLSTLPTKPFQQTPITNFSSVPRKNILVQQPFKTTFLNNIAPPFFRTPLPEPNKRFISTLQLAFARHILLTKKSSLSSPMPRSLGTVEDDIQVMGLEGTDRLWMNAISKDPIEQDRLRWLTAKVVFQFLKSSNKDAMLIAEVTLLGSILDCQDYRGVLSSLIRQLEQEALLDQELLRGLVYFLQSASPGYLIDDDLVKILRVLRSRLEETYMQLGDTKKPASKHIYLLAIAVSRVLDTMVEGNVKGLNRTEDHRPLLDILAGLKDSPDLYLKYQATYAWQALQYIGDDESPLKMALRVGEGLFMAGLGVASAFKLDIECLFNGLRELGEAAGQVLDATKAVIESAQAARDAGEGVVDSLLKGFRTGDKRAWYPALQGARVFIREGRLAEFKRVVYEAPCRHDQEFQWGICQLLGEMAMDPIWGTEICQQAVYFLEDLHRSDLGWTKDSSVRDAICGILLRISKSAEKIMPIHVDSLSQDSRQDNGDKSAEPFPLITRLPTPESSLLLAEVIKIPSLEYDLHRIMAQRVEAHQQPVYIPPHAKTSLQASDNEYFPLMDKVIEFLASDRQVFLILGNSGSGKSTFSRHLHYVLSKDYNHDRPIPIFIHLPTVRNPGTGLISEHLKTLNFMDDDIQELKRDRQFIIICDSYDEIRLSINLHTSNMLNRPGQWNAKMIISCRSTHARRDYIDLFQPQPLHRYDPSKRHLFQEAAIIPFSKNQIKDYVDQFVQETEVHKLFPDRSIWSAAEYMDKLTRIPNLLQLVTNPFLLNLSLRSLPVFFKEHLDPSKITITRLNLFGIFIDEWLEVNRQRLRSMDHSEAAKAKLDELVEGDFKQIAIEFLQNLAKAIYEEQAGHSVVKYVHREDKETWKAKFFGPDEEIMLLRQSSPLTCVENLHSFIHRSLLEYFRSLQMARLTPPTSKRDISKEPPWFCRVVSGTRAVAAGAGAIAVGAAAGAGAAASGALTKVDGVWMRTVQVLTTRKAHVDYVCPIAKTSYVYYDDEVYDAVLVEKSTGITYVIQLIFNSETKTYYVFYRWGETDYKLDGPHDTIEAAKEAFQVTYKENFDVEWKEREIATSERWTYEVKTYETFEEIEEVEEVVEETQAELIIAREKEIEVDNNTKITEETVTIVTDEVVAVEHENTMESVVVKETETVKETITEKESGEVAKPAVSEKSSWFRRALSGAEAAALGAGALVVGAGAVAVGVTVGAVSGAGHVASDALHKADGVWKRTVQVLTTRKAHVDHLCPIAKTSYVYYDDEVYDSVLVEKSTGITYVTQLIFDSETKVYYVYVRWGEKDYKLDGPHETIEAAKDAFQVTYKEKFDVEWKEREIATSERWIYEVKTYETFEEIEEVEEVIEEMDVEAGVVDVEKVQVDVEVDAEVVDDDKVKEVVVVEVAVAPSPSLPECNISGIPASLGHLTTASLLSEMSASPVFDDQSLGSMDLEEEPDILQFLVDRVHEDPDFTKLLLWTVYKSGAEGIVNQSTKNATCILEMAGIRFLLQV